MIVLRGPEVSTFPPQIRDVGPTKEVFIFEITKLPRTSSPSSEFGDKSEEGRHWNSFSVGETRSQKHEYFGPILVDVMS